jgi:hypothetical protein
MTEHRIFVSYSRKDSAIVTPLVHLLRLGGSGVFRDVDHILPGIKWRAVLIGAVESCELLVLFWCCHSSRSVEVEKEYKQALTSGKLLAPVLLDDTPLTAELAEYQAIDMRGLFGDHVGYVPEFDLKPPKLHLHRPRGPIELPRFREVICQPNEAAMAAAGKHLQESLAVRLGVRSMPDQVGGATAPVDQP